MRRKKKKCNSKMIKKTSNNNKECNNKDNSKQIQMISIVLSSKKPKSLCKKVKNPSLLGNKKERRLVVSEWEKSVIKEKRVTPKPNNKLSQNKV